ncbi:MAG: hypothetical protein JWM34_2734 [Ilumatobacteraceae bacterium]|nr:hypothetical protein [Ilumatobacteraceae bacterium]
MLAGVLLALVLVSVATGGEVRLWHAAPDSGGYDNATSVTQPLATFPTTPPKGQESSSELPGWIIVVLQVLVVVGALAIAAWLVVAAWINRPHWTSRRVGRKDFDVMPDVASSISDDAAEQRAALMRGSPRNAIVECWLRLEGVVASAGLPRDPAHTSSEFTEQVLGAYSVDPAAIASLAALYREARFSTHVMDEQDRAVAVAALDRLHDGLRTFLAADTRGAAVEAAT